MNENGQNQQPKTLLEALVIIRPLLPKAIQSEIDALQKLLDKFYCTTVKELSSKVNVDPATALIDKIEKFFVSRDALASKEKLLSGDANESREASIEELNEPLETLAQEFRSSTRKTIKSMAKKFDVNLATPDDAEKFENWLRTGQKPETVNEQLEKDLRPLAQELTDHIDKYPSSRPEDAIEYVLQFGEEIKLQFKIEGLKVFLKLLGINTSGKTGKVLLNQLKAHYAQILSMGGKSA